MYKDLLPIGSIITIKGTDTKVMICGRIIARGDSGEIYDYVGCLYPQGVVDSDNLYFFNRDVIDQYLFIGFQDQDEMLFRNNVLNELGELEVVDGQIREKK